MRKREREQRKRREERDKRRDGLIYNEKSRKSEGRREEKKRRIPIGTEDQKMRLNKLATVGGGGGGEKDE